MKPPYYAVIFTSILEENKDGYAEMSEKMAQLASQQEGFLGMDSARSEIGITVSYWKDLASIQQWRQNSEHLIAQKLGRNQWYRKFSVKIALVEREYDFER
jgi:heme-degrading monooxygenase HmoA